MAIKQNVGKLNEQKRDVKATFAECKAENPLECKYHGTKALGTILAPVLKNGFDIKAGNGVYYLSASCSDWKEAEKKINAALSGSGFKASATNGKDGKINFFIEKENSEFNYSFITPEDEVDLSYDAEKTQTNGDDVVEDPDKPPVKNSSKSGVSIDQIKDFLIKDGYLEEDVNKWDDSSFKSWYDLIDNGVGPDGGKLLDSNKDMIKEMAAHVGLDHPVSKAIAKMMEEKYGEKIDDNGEEKSEEEGVADDVEITVDDILEYINDAVSEDIAKGYIKEVTEGKSFLTGKDLDEIDIAFWNDQAQKNPGHKVAKAWMKTLAKLQGEDTKNEEKKADNGNAKSEDDEDITEEDMKDYLKGTWAETMAKEYISEVKEGKKSVSVGGGWIDKADIHFWNNLAQNKPDHKVAKIWAKTLSKLQGTKGETGSNEKEEVKPNDNDESVDASEFDGDILEEITASGEIESGFKEELDEFADMLEEKNTDKPKDDEVTTDDIKDFFKKCGIKKGVLLSDDNLTATKEALETGKWKGKALTNKNKQWYKALADKAPDHKVAKAISAMISGDDKFKPKKNKVTQAQKDALTGAKEDAVIGKTSPSVAEISKKLLKPLAHEEANFPTGVTKKVLDELLSHKNYASSLAEALAQKKSYPLGGASGDHATLIHIDDKPYVVKAGSGSHAEHIHNEVLADQAYRSGGIRVPDCKEYVFDEKDSAGKTISTKTYKLAEFIEGKSLRDYMEIATEAQKEDVRRDLLAGFPMDVLFSNWDVIGTSRDNVLVDKEGHAWRIDNGGSFAMAAQSNKKTMKWAIDEYIKKPEQNNKPPLAAFENWDAEGGWDKRQWIDDFRTMRIDPKNKGVFDQYSTADIFLSAANINFANAVSGLPQELKEALSKPLFEMREMAHQANCARDAGYSTERYMKWKDADGNTVVTDIDTMSSALDAIYEAHKDGCREWLQKKTTWGSLGWLSKGGGGNGYQKKVFPEEAPPEPLPPPKGTDLTTPILKAIKSINYHINQGDYSPNKSSIKKAMELKPVLEMLNDDNVDKAKGLIEAIGKIEAAAQDGYKKPLVFNTPNGMFDVKGLSLVFDESHEAIFKKNTTQKHAEWEKAMEAYTAKKTKWDEEEARKAKAAGAAPEDSFGAYEDKLIKANIGTNGVPRGGGNPQCNKASKKSQKSSSFLTESCKKKVRQYAMMGIPLDEMYFPNGDKVFYNGNIENGGYHVSGHNTSEKDYYAAIDFYRQNPDIFRVDMEAYARHKGMMALVHMNIENDGIDADDGTVFVMREEHVEAWGKHGVNKPTGKSRVIDRYPIDSSTSAQINGTGTLGVINIGWKLPIWRVTDNFMISDPQEYKTGDGEMEICVNPINIPYPPMYFSKDDAKLKWKHCMDLYLAAPEVKAIMEERKKTFMPH